MLLSRWCTFRFRAGKGHLPDKTVYQNGPIDTSLENKTESVSKDDL